MQENATPYAEVKHLLTRVCVHTDGEKYFSAFVSHTESEAILVSSGDQVTAQVSQLVQ